MLPIDAHELISNWFVSQNASGVEFREAFPSTRDPTDDYKVVYEAIFEPQTLRKARVEIWITDQGNISFGFETRQRIAMRFSLANWRRGFAAGYEPRALSPDDLITLLQTVSDGKLSLSIRTFFGVLGRIRAVMSQEDRRALQDASRDVDWVGITNRKTERPKFGISDTVVQFQSWRHRV
jgi:hypothetical protein